MKAEKNTKLRRSQGVNERKIVPVPILTAREVPELGAAPDVLLVGYWRPSEDPGLLSFEDQSMLNSHLAHLEEIRTTGKARYAIQTRGRSYRTPAEVIGYLEAEIETLSGKLQELPWPGHHVDPTMAQSERERVACLLDAGPVCVRFLGYSWDRLDETKPILGSCCRSAAGYRWPEGLSHYVRKYGLVLPEEMIRALESLPV